MKTIIRLTALIIMLAVPGCLALDTSDSDNPVTGIYYLVKVDGSGVPTDVSHDGTMLHVRSGVFIISDDGSCFSRTHFIPPGGEEIIREVHASFIADESRLVMKWEGAGVTEGTVAGKTFTMDNHGVIFEYVRRP